MSTSTAATAAEGWIQTVHPSRRPLRGAPQDEDFC
jgi:hypothetical protein